MADRVKSEMIPKVAIAINESKLKNHTWAVFTEDTVTQNAISAHLWRCGESELNTREIYYDNELKVCFSVNFDVVLFLSKNKHRVPYKFTAYHREFKNSPWRMWKEGMKSPGEYLAKRFERPK